MTQQTRIEQLESIRDLATEGSYDEAIRRISRFLRGAPHDLEAIRLKGNMLELKALDRAQYHCKKLLRSEEYLEARRCYERILKVDEGNTLALIDLGDHFANLGAHDKAGSYYEAALTLLRQGESRTSWRDEVAEAFDRYIDLCNETGRVHDKQRLEREKRSLLDKPPSL